MMVLHCTDSLHMLLGPQCACHRAASSDAVPRTYGPSAFYTCAQIKARASKHTRTTVRACEMPPLSSHRAIHARLSLSLVSLVLRNP
eukprot:2140535-Amphidinium_carterae.1